MLHTLKSVPGVALPLRAVERRAQALACVILLALGCADDPGTPPPPPPAGLVLVKSVPVPERYGIHDTFVRDGLAFVLAWDAGVFIYDVGNGMSGGTPQSPALVSSVATTWGQAHNAWWFHNPNTGERR